MLRVRRQICGVWRRYGGGGRARFKRRICSGLRSYGGGGRAQSNQLWSLVVGVARFKPTGGAIARGWWWVFQPVVRHLLQGPTAFQVWDLVSLVMVDLGCEVGVMGLVVSAGGRFSFCLCFLFALIPRVLIDGVSVGGCGEGNKVDKRLELCWLKERVGNLRTGYALLCLPLFVCSSFVDGLEREKSKAFPFLLCKDGGLFRKVLVWMS